MVVILKHNHSPRVPGLNLCNGCLRMAVIRRKPLARKVNEPPALLPRLQCRRAILHREAFKCNEKNGESMRKRSWWIARRQEPRRASGFIYLLDQASRWSPQPGGSTPFERLSLLTRQSFGCVHARPASVIDTWTGTVTLKVLVASLGLGMRPFISPFWCVFGTVSGPRPRQPGPAELKPPPAEEARGGRGRGGDFRGSCRLGQADCQTVNYTWTRCCWQLEYERNTTFQCVLAAFFDHLTHIWHKKCTLNRGSLNTGDSTIHWKIWTLLKIINNYK
jgi:hypothetical protein